MDISLSKCHTFSLDGAIGYTLAISVNTCTIHVFSASNVLE